MGTRSGCGGTSGVTMTSFTSPPPMDIRRTSFAPLWSISEAKDAGTKPEGPTEPSAFAHPEPPTNAPANPVSRASSLAA